MWTESFLCLVHMQGWICIPNLYSYEYKLFCCWLPCGNCRSDVISYQQLKKKKKKKETGIVFVRVIISLRHFLWPRLPGVLAADIRAVHPGNFLSVPDSLQQTWVRTKLRRLCHVNVFTFGSFHALFVDDCVINKCWCVFVGKF